MTKESALNMMALYSTHATGPDDVLHEIQTRFPAGGDASKANRWLGFCQGVLHERGVYTLEELKDMTRLVVQLEVESALPSPIRKAQGDDQKEERDVDC